MIDQAGLLIDNAAIEWLSDHLDDEEAGASTHWRGEHKTFKYEDGKLHGLRGFGHHSPPARGLRGVVHTLLQKRFRKMGKSFSRFKELDQIAASIVTQQDRLYDLVVLRQVLALSQLMEMAPDCFREGKTVLVIGDGFGDMASLILAVTANVRVVTVNLTKTLLVDLLYTSKVMEGGSFALAVDAEGVDAFRDNTDIRLLGIQADNAALIEHFPISLAINIASMQEMTPKTISVYFDILRTLGDSDTFLYCCNREEKVLPDGTIVRFEEYPWHEKDTIIFDAPCPWHQFYYSPIPPLYPRYNGIIRHRLMVLDKSIAGFIPKAIKK